MAETAEQPNLPAGLLSSPGQKRKRGEHTSPGERRSKRVAPPATMAPSADPTSFIESAVEAATAGVNVADFSALQQATADHSEAANPANASTTAAAALGSMFPTIHVPQTTEEKFAATHPVEDHSEDLSLLASDVSHPDGLPSVPVPAPIPPPSVGALAPPTNGIRPPETRFPTMSAPSHKPTVGSEEWHKMRKDNHKEVERRRRETINEGINELSKIVPGCEKNKGSILQRAVQFISQLKENEAQNIEKWTLEKLLTEQAIAELSQSNDKLKTECERLYRELETWKSVAQSAGLQPPAAKEEPATAASS